MLRTLQVYTKSGSWHRTMVRPQVNCVVTGCGGGVGGLRGRLVHLVGGISCSRTSSSRGFVVCIACCLNRSESCTLCLVNNHCKSGRCLSCMYNWLRLGRMLTDVLSRINSTGSASFRCCTLHTSCVLVPEWKTSNKYQISCG